MVNATQVTATPVAEGDIGEAHVPSGNRRTTSSVSVLRSGSCNNMMSNEAGSNIVKKVAFELALTVRVRQLLPVAPSKIDTPDQDP
jgi:hypothetical protein